MITTTALDALRFLFEASDVFGCFAPVGKDAGSVGALRARDKSWIWEWECASAAGAGSALLLCGDRRTLWVCKCAYAITITITTSNSNCISSHSGTSSTRTHPTQHWCARQSRFCSVLASSNAHALSLHRFDNTDNSTVTHVRPHT